MVVFLKVILGLIGVVGGLCRYGVRFVVAMFLSRADSAARIIALESQLDESMRQNSPKRRYRFSHSFRFLWVILVSFWNSWETVCHAMKPRTVVGWWQQGFRRYWRSISQGKPGRKGLSIELRKLIRRMSLENPLWGGAKIRDVLVELEYQRLDVGTIRKYMKKRSKDPSGTWKASLRNHMNVAWGMDFCVVRSVGFKALYVFVIIEHVRRKIRRIAVTETPSAAWIIQQLREATSFEYMPRFMDRDNDGIYGGEVPRFLKRSFIDDIRNSFRSPWQNPFTERFFGSLRRELLDHVIVWNASHLENLLAEYVDWYENHRLHQSHGGTAPNNSDTNDGTVMDVKIVSIPVLGGLHHRYERKAA